MPKHASPRTAAIDPHDSAGPGSNRASSVPAGPKHGQHLGEVDRCTVFGAPVDGCAPTLVWQVPYELLQIHNEVQSRIEDIIDSIPLEQVAEFLDAATNAYRDGDREQIGRIASQLARAGFGAPPTPWLRTRLWAELQAFAALDVVLQNTRKSSRVETAVSPSGPTPPRIAAPKSEVRTRGVRANHV